MFVKKGADVASGVAASLLNIRAAEGNYSKIMGYFEKFCSIEKVESEISIYQRKLFVSTMLHLYNPQVYHVPVEYITLNFGFVRHMSRCLGIDGSNMSKTIRQVVFEESVYEEYRDKVRELLDEYKTTR